MGKWACTLENMVAKCFNDVFKGRNILVTGHTGFKGSWLSLWLSSLGGNVTGLSLEPNTNPSHWELLKLNSVKEFIGDIRDKDFVSKVLESSHPEIIFHLAAQPLVRDSYLDPRANLVDKCNRDTKFIRSIKKVG